MNPAEERAREIHEELTRATVTPPNTPVTWNELSNQEKRAAMSQAKAQLDEETGQ